MIVLTDGESHDGEELKDALEECEERNVTRYAIAVRCSTYMDIVIVLDGSNSIYPWYEVQNFLSNILSKFFIDPEQIQVGVLQYSEVAVHEWTLKDYKTAEEVIEAAQNISRQEGLETRTASAIHKAW
ncbi:PREDICTED: integrin alpha-10-like [Thamnophis sirtalis]|uniref:Integrin alpha-10-like n=1 Tax=Thamnophis sirtalis TaxID=35019 RepID=A0A6I9Z208_9SAUR|nr:PREDICTED: integrin alpha-10-like [Thamnophis sirtalis]